MNSFSAIQKACEYEIQRQIKAYESGEPIVQEPVFGTRASSSPRACAVRRAPVITAISDPDLGPIEVSVDLRGLALELPELPAAKRHRAADDLGLSQYDARAY